MSKIAVLLSGCGVFDGSEIHEATLTLLNIVKAGYDYQIIAPNRPQHDVVNHLTQTADETSRNCLVEAGRIARGSALALDQANVDDYVALIVPGGFGAAKNLCDFALKNSTDFNIQPDVATFITAFKEANKPVGMMCIAPVMLPKLYPKGIKMTLGTDPELASLMTTLGADYYAVSVDQVVIDEVHRVVTTPAYMLAQSIGDLEQGIARLVDVVVGMV